MSAKSITTNAARETGQESANKTMAEYLRPISAEDRVKDEEGDMGTVDSINGEKATVRWDQGVVTTGPVRSLKRIAAIF